MRRRSIEHLLALSFIPLSLTSYCGQASIPFTFQVLHSGLTVLGCAQPQCFGWNANGTRAVQTAEFYSINGKQDGYIRRSDQMQRSVLQSSFITPSVANCDEFYSMKSCAPGQWVGGIAPRGSKLQIRCCWYAPLLNSEDRGVAMVTNGQLVVGGEVMNDGDLDGFDYISNIKMEDVKDGKTVYAVSIRRMRCTDEDISNESQMAQNALFLKRGDESQAIANKRRFHVKQSSPKTHHVSGTIYATSHLQNFDETHAHRQWNQPQYVESVTSAPHHILSNEAASNYLPTQAAINLPPDLQTIQHLPYPTLQQANLAQAPSAVQSVQQSHVPFLQAAQPLPYQFNGLFNSGPNTLMAPFQQLPGAPSQLQSPVPLPASTTPLPTLPTITFPRLDQIPKIEIPSVEDVENVIPPVQKAILTTVAKFFGVL